MFLSKYWAMVCKLMPTPVYLKWQFYHIYHKNLNLKNPQTYAEKLSYLKAYEHDERLTKLVDKYAVREYVKKIIGDQYLIPLLGVYETANEIKWDDLPRQYVLKCTHDSASVILHINGQEFDREKAIKSLNSHLQRNVYWYAREYPYKNVVPKIVCEEFLDDNGKSPSDYKIMCFSGKPKYIVLDMDRFENHRRDIYDTSWNKQDITTDHEQSDLLSPKPQNFDEMLELARKLSKGFKHVRVDFYNLNGKIYFGEMTFFPWGGPIWFKPDEWNYKLGSLINLNQ